MSRSAALVLGDLRVDEFFSVLLKLMERAFLIEAHQPAVTGNIASPYRSKSALNTIFCHADALEGQVLFRGLHVSGCLIKQYRPQVTLTR